MVLLAVLLRAVCSTYINSKTDHMHNLLGCLQVLNRARKALPAEQSIWITAAQLEEANGNSDMADKIVNRALKVGPVFIRACSSRFHYATTSCTLGNLRYSAAEL
jgi:hypothetical protein